MSVFTAIAFATFFLENDHFLTLHEGNENFAVYFGTFNGRCTNSYVAVGFEKKYFVERDSVSLFYFIAEVVNIQILAFFGLELLSLDFYNCVHC